MYSSNIIIENKLNIIPPVYISASVTADISPISIDSAINSL